MGLLDSNSLNEWAMGIPGRAKAMYQGLLNAPAELKEMFTPQFAAKAREAYMRSPYIIGSVMSQKGLLDAGSRDKAMQLAMDVMPGGIAGTFIGKGAKTWDATANAKAMQMAKEGVDPRIIWKETGNWKAPDGMWRQEIPDNLARFNVSSAGENPLVQGYGDMNVGAAFGHKNAVLDHPLLADAYNASEIAPRTNVRDSMTMLNNERGAFDPSTGTMTLFAPASVEQAKSTTLHELQHAIQQREGWARGGSPDELAKRYQSAQDEYDLMFQTMKANPERADEIRPILDNLRNEYRDLANPDEAYRRLAGEAEARATQARMNMDMAQRLNTFPEDSYDVPINQLIIRGLLGQ